jgi:hypothetical protein
MSPILRKNASYYFQTNDPKIDTASPAIQLKNSVNQCKSVSKKPSCFFVPFVVNKISVICVICGAPRSPRVVFSVLRKMLRGWLKSKSFIAYRNIFCYYFAIRTADNSLCNPRSPAKPPCRVLRSPAQSRLVGLCKTAGGW